MAVVADIARIAHGLVHVVRGVGGRERFRVGRMLDHAAPDALHRHERVPHDAPLGGHALLLERSPDVAHGLGLRVVWPQIPGQGIEGRGGGERDDVALAHGLLDHEVDVRSLSRDAIGLPALEESGAADVGEQQPDVALGIDLVDQDVRVIRAAHLDLHAFARLVDRLVPAVGPHLDRLTRVRSAGNQQRRERQKNACPPHDDHAPSRRESPDLRSRGSLRSRPLMDLPSLPGRERSSPEDLRAFRRALPP